MRLTPYIIKVKNNSEKKAKFVLFGHDQYKSIENYGSEKDVVVTPYAKNVTYLQLLNQSAHQPIDVDKIKIYSTNANQRKESFDVTWRDIENKQVASFPVHPIEYISFEDDVIGIVEIPIKSVINNGTDISSYIFPNTELIFMIYGKVKETTNKRKIIKKDVKYYLLGFAVGVITTILAVSVLIN